MKANWRSLVRVLATCCGVWTTQGCAGDPPMIDDPQVKGPLVPTAQGTVRGKVDEGAQVFLGIPYAAPPTGTNRFAAPKPAAPFSGIYAAGEIGPACPQLSSGKVEEGTSEDCLTLNIWKPTQVSTPRPVLVFLHGGGFVSGSGGLPLYDGKHLSVTQDVVVVTLNYRLGPLGFFAHAALSQQDRSGAGASNFGLLDQQAALAWVRDNIAGFGGDANNVTLFGESAGGMSVCAQLASPRAAGLFHRAIVQSGPCSAIVPPTQAAAEAQGAVLAQKLGCPGADPAALVACLQKAPLSAVMTALPQKAEVVFGEGYAWNPTVDPVVLPKAPATVFAQKSQHRVPLIVGANQDEGTAFVALGVKLDTEAEIRAALASLFPAPTVDAILRHYGTGPIGRTTGLQILGDAFVCDARRLARWTSAAGIPTFSYHFTRAFAYLLPDLGAFHGAELPYLFHTPLEFVTIKPHEEDFSAQLQGYWARFAQSGDPTGPRSVPWPRYDATTDSILKLDLRIEPVSNLRKQSCDFWDTLIP